MPVYILSDKLIFPHPSLTSSNGLLAIGGDLSAERLLLAYKMGIFPWYSENEPILWWCPDVRPVLYPDEFRLSKSLKKTIKKQIFKITADRAFKAVINECCEVRKEKGEGTWLNKDMLEAYCALYDMGFAHSVEAWYDGRLAGGLYGVCLGGSFFGESMFTRKTDASKTGFAALVSYLKSKNFDLIDCQIPSRHLSSLGAKEISRDIFLKQLEASMLKPTITERWDFKGLKIQG